MHKGQAVLEDILDLLYSVGLPERLDDVLVLGNDLILNTVDKVLRFKQVGHDDVRITDHLSLHAFDGMVKLRSVAVNFVRHEAIHHVSNARLLVEKAAHNLKLLSIEVPLLA